MVGSYPNTRQGTVTTFQCDDGYVPVMSGVTNCSEIGRWDPEPGDHNCTLISGKHDIIFSNYYYYV